MDTEQLQMVLTTLSQLGVEGKSAFIWWLFFDKALGVIGWLLTFGGFTWCVLKISNIISAQSTLAQIRDYLGIGAHGPVSSYEAAQVLKTVKSLMERVSAIPKQ